MENKHIELKIDNKLIQEKLLDISKKTENLRPLMKNLAGILSFSTEENFKEEGRPKWQEWSEATKKYRKKVKKYPGQILQLNGHLASSVTTYYDDNSAIIGSNLPYAAIHQLGSYAGKNKKVKIPARPYINLSDSDQKEIINAIVEYLE